MSNSILISNSTSNYWQIPEQGYFDTKKLSCVRSRTEFTIAATFCLEWDPKTLDVNTNSIYSVIHSVNFSKHDSASSMIEIMAQIKERELHITFRVSVPLIRRYTVALPGHWRDYNSRWMTAIFSATDHRFLNSYLYDTETKELLQETSFCCDMWNFPNFDRFDTPRLDKDIRIDGYSSVQNHGYRLAHVYGTFGNMLDPNENIVLCASGVPETIGSTDAWYNISLDQYENFGDHIYIKSHNSKIYTHEHGHAMLLPVDLSYFYRGYSKSAPKNWV